MLKYIQDTVYSFMDLNFFLKTQSNFTMDNGDGLRVWVMVFMSGHILTSASVFQTKVGSS